ncbi:hypothetical protein KR009_003307 [Drosophila setifemur]|nr:hypothetical protein KR009_003307 [Drosophila setifemur]
MWKLQYLLVIFLLLSPGTDASYLQLLEDLSNELHFDYAVILGDSDPIWQKLFWQLPIPIIQIDWKSKNNYQLGNGQSHNFLTLAFLDESPQESLEFLYLNLGMLNTLPVLLVLKERIMPLYTLLEVCWHYKLINVVAIDPDFEDTLTLYSFAPFPIFQFIERILERNTLIFEPRIWNLHGYHLPFVVGGSPPRFIVSRDSDGEMIFSGVVGNLKKCFEQRFNCKLVTPYPFDETSVQPSQELVVAVRNGSVQFAFCAIFPNIPNLFGCTYPFELMSWCLMMPVPEEVPHSWLYSMVFDPSAFVLLLSCMAIISLILSLALQLHGYRVNFGAFLLHDSCLRGVLAQSFNEVLRAPALVRGMYVVICLLGILITAWYNSYFSTFVTSAPRLPPLTSYESIKNSNVKVVVWKPEYETLIRVNEGMGRYSSIFQVEPEYKMFLQLRDSFDTRYGYMMPMEKWSLVKEQQRVFSSPLFTLREDLCFYHTIPIGFPIANNSVFREPLERLILDVTATGLLDRWHDMAFTDMIRAGQLGLVDRGKPKEFRAMQLEDLQQIWVTGGLLLGFATIVFFMELIWFWRQKIRQKLGVVLRFGRK